MQNHSFIKSLFAFITAMVWMSSSCSKGNNPDISSNVPYVSVNITININNAPYTNLKTVGGQAYANGGYRGIILSRTNNSTVAAFDRTCTYNISDNNGIVQAQTNGTAICLQCSSTYNLTNGGVNSGPTTIGLKQYSVTFNPTSGDVTVKN
ncbi:MAG TPA: hypothetical protein VN922_03770 [Bacteroidia bacterium]|nr:hypothetical protein [Bacteroidia bacterium]